MWYVGKTKNQKPAMTGNGKHTTYKNGDDWGMVNTSHGQIASARPLVGVCLAPGCAFVQEDNTESLGEAKSFQISLTFPRFTLW